MRTFKNNVTQETVSAAFYGGGGVPPGFEEHIISGHGVLFIKGIMLPIPPNFYCYLAAHGFRILNRAAFEETFTEIL